MVWTGTDRAFGRNVCQGAVILGLAGVLIWPDFWWCFTFPAIAVVLLVETVGVKE